MKSFADAKSNSVSSIAARNIALVAIRIFRGKLLSNTRQITIINAQETNEPPNAMAIIDHIICVVTFSPATSMGTTKSSEDMLQTATVIQLAYCASVFFETAGVGPLVTAESTICWIPEYRQCDRTDGYRARQAFIGQVRNVNDRRSIEFNCAHRTTILLQNISDGFCHFEW